MGTKTEAPHRPAARCAAGLLACLLLGCHAAALKPSPPDGGAPDAGPAAAARPSTPDPGSLSPSFREAGPPGALPDQIVIELAVPAVDGTQVRRTVSRDTRVELRPAARGQLEFTNPTTLVFRPEEPLRFGTDYEVTLASVRTSAGVIRPPVATAWSYRFSTPAFSLLQASPRAGAAQGDTLAVDLVFSGDVDPGSLKGRATFTVGGAPLHATIGRGADARTATAVLSGRALAPGARIQFALAAGARSASGRDRAGAASDSFELLSGPAITIHRATLRESATGFYIEVSCTDAAAGAPPRYEWHDWEDEEAEGGWHWQHRPRCQLTDGDAAEGIHITPEVKLSVVPSHLGFRIIGDFRRGKYALSIRPGVRSVDGGVLPTRFDTELTVGPRSPQLRFLSTGRYLPRQAWRSLPIHHMNVDGATLSVRHVPPENLVFWMSDDARETADERNSNLLLKKQLPLSGRPDAPSTTWVDVGSLLPSTTRGVLELSLSHPGAPQSVSRLLLTDLSLVAKRAEGGEVRAWALDITSGKPLSNVEMSLIRKSGLAVARCSTDGERGCSLKPPPGDPDPSPPFALVARRGDDLTYLKYSELKTEIAEVDIHGEPYQTQDRPYRAALYTDRGVYRPGDTVHLGAIVRDRSNVAPGPGLPVELRLLDPKGQTASKVALRTNEGGLVTWEHALAAFADTGVYSAELRVADKPLTAVKVNVEEFVPERMKLSLGSGRTSYAMSEPVQVSVEARYLFGGSAEGSPSELHCSIVPAPFRPKQNAQYAYGPWRDPGSAPRKPLLLGEAKGELDAHGHAILTCPAPGDGAFQDPGTVVAHAAVFESGSGRSTQGELTVPVHPERFYLGLDAQPASAEAGKAVAIKGIVVDWNGAPLDVVRQLDAEVVRLESEYGWIWDDASGGERFQRLLRPVVEGRMQALVKGARFAFSVTPTSDAPGYLVRARAGAARTDLYLKGKDNGYDWDWDYPERRVDQTPRPAKATSLPLALPTRTRVGERTEVHVKAPYRGRILFTVETDHVVKAEWRDAQGGDVAWAFVLDRFVPNVYVSAFLVKDPHLESAQAFMPDRAFGVGSVPVEPTELTQGLTLKVPASVRSNSKLTVELGLTSPDGPTYATVAAVDEGILSLTRFKSPDPSAILFAQRALGVETFETVGWTLLLPAAGPSRGTGGDASGAASGRVQPVKPVALWSGVVPVRNGRATVTFDVPQYRGALRVMAVTAGPRRVGHASATVTVKDPLVLTTTLPRFLTENDRFQIPVFLSNLSGKAMDVHVSLAAEALPVPGMAAPLGAPAPLKLLGRSKGEIRLEDGHSGTLVFQAEATQLVGAARLNVTAQGGGFESHETLDVPFSPAGPRSRSVRRVELSEGEIDLMPYLNGWVPTSEKSTFWVTTNPYGEAFDHLRYVIQYPYGCIEQTTSSTRPLLFVSRFLRSEEPDLFAGKGIEDRVMAGINRVFSMQTPSGGFAYWPGGVEPNGWGTAYATHMLLDAQRLGYPVAQDRLDEALAWMDQQLGQASASDVDRWHGHGEDEAQAYMGYVLALAGRPHKATLLAWLEALPKNATGEAAERLYMLEAALYLSGDHRYEAELRHPDISPLSEQRLNNWDFYSDRRRRGFMLSTFTELFGDDPAGEPLAQQVAESLKGHPSGWYTTQEITWSMTGLGKRLEGRAARFAPSTLTASGTPLAPAPGAPQAGGERTWAVARASELPSLKLKLPSKGNGRVFLFVASEGVREHATYEVGGHGLSVERTFHARDGALLDLHKPMQLAQLAYVQVTLSNHTGERVQNLALVDRLPAGWEIENPRLGRGDKLDWVDDATAFAPDGMNVRDDRLEVFGALGPHESRTLTYGVRAVTAGTFTLPPVEAEAMYDPTLWARGAGGVVNVGSPWTDELL